MAEITIPHIAFISFPNRHAEASGVSFHELSDYFKCYPGGISDILFTALVFSIPQSNLAGFAEVACFKYKEHSRVLLDKELVDLKTYDNIYRVFRRMILALWRYIAYTFQPFEQYRKIYELKELKTNQCDGSFIAIVTLEQ